MGTPWGETVPPGDTRKLAHRCAVMPGGADRLEQGRGGWGRNPRPPFIGRNPRPQWRAGDLRAWWLDPTAEKARRLGGTGRIAGRDYR